MQIARLQNEKSVTEIAARIYDLKPDDPRAAAAGKALVAANPHLGGNLAALPAGTPVVVPTIAGVNAIGSATNDPRHAVWIGILDGLIDSARQASNLQQTGEAAKPLPDAKRVQALAALSADIAEFKKLHG